MKYIRVRSTIETILGEAIVLLIEIRTLCQLKESYVAVSRYIKSKLCILFFGFQYQILTFFLNLCSIRKKTVSLCPKLDDQVLICRKLKMNLTCDVMKSLICALQNGGGQMIRAGCSSLVISDVQCAAMAFCCSGYFFMDTKVSSKQKVGVVAL